MFGLQHPLTCKPRTTLSKSCNKVRGEYFSKEVFLRLPSCVLYSCVCRLSYVCYHCVGMYPVYICVFLHESADDNATVGWGCRTYRLHLCRKVKTPFNECPVYDTKQSDGEIVVMLELWGMRSTPSMPFLPGTLWPGVVVPTKGPIHGLNRIKPWFEFTVFSI